jgi:hypothetical protein
MLLHELRWEVLHTSRHQPDALLTVVQPTVATPWCLRGFLCMHATCAQLQIAPHASRMRVAQRRCEGLFLRSTLTPAVSLPPHQGSPGNPRSCLLSWVLQTAAMQLLHTTQSHFVTEVNHSCYATLRGSFAAACPFSFGSTQVMSFWSMSSRLAQEAIKRAIAAAQLYTGQA